MPGRKNQLGVFPMQVLVGLCTVMSGLGFRMSTEEQQQDKARQQSGS